MTRIVITIVVPLVVPSLLYLLWFRATGRVAVNGIWALPWPWLIASGVVLTAVTLVIVSVHFGNAPDGAYVPPHVVGGKVVPGQVVPDAKP